MFKQNISSIIVVVVLLVMTKTAQATVADTHFAKFHPVSGSVAAGSLPESSPFTFSSTDFSQVRIADRMSQLKLGEPNSGGWDMTPLTRLASMPADTYLSLLKLWKQEYSV